MILYFTHNFGFGFYKVSTMHTTIGDIIKLFDREMPFSLQENYDNSGLICGNVNEDVKGVLIALDATEDVVQDAIDEGCNLLIAHHPIVFKGLKSLTGKNYIERAVIKAIKNDVAILAVHTNSDNVLCGVNSMLANKLSLYNTTVLRPKSELYKLVRVGVPEEIADEFGLKFNQFTHFSQDYYQNAFTGYNTFTEFTQKDQSVQKVKEQMLEFLVPQHQLQSFMKIMFEQHPYEQPIYSVIDVANQNLLIGSGVVGNLQGEENLEKFLADLKKILGVAAIKYTGDIHKKVKKIAICGGAGIFLLNDAIKAGADVFITSDVKYHEFFDAENKITLIDVGHFESEQFTIALFKDLIKRNFHTFAVHLTKVNTNPVKYYI